MDFFDQLEKSLEKLIETTLMGKGGGQVQPIEIARGLWRETTAAKRVSLKGTYVPNYFLLTLSERDYSFFEPIRKTVDKEILEHLERESRVRDFRTVGPVVIDWVKSEEMENGRYSISSDFLGIDEIPSHLINEKADQESFQNTFKTSGPKKIEASAPVLGFLHVIEGFEKGKIFNITTPETIIGRSDECDISLGDPRVSRRHLCIFAEGDEIYAEDLKSRSGTEVDGKSIKRTVLRQGSRIVIGGTVLLYKSTP